LPRIVGHRYSGNTIAQSIIGREPATLSGAADLDFSG
jgi:hypothetical protein